jgi:hypothetical protein
VKEERFRVPAVRGKPEVELVLERVVIDVVELAAAPLSLRDQVRHLPRAEVAGPREVLTDGVLVVELPVDVMPVSVVERAELVDDIRRAAAIPVELGVRDALGCRHELVEPGDQLGRKRCLAVERARVVHEPEQRLDVTASEGRHTEKDTTNVVSTQRRCAVTVRPTSSTERRKT